MGVVFKLIVFCFLFYCVDAGITWSKSYSFKAKLSVPSADIDEPYQVWVDGDAQKSRVDFYNGLDKWYREWDKISSKYIYYKIQPEATKKYSYKDVCHVSTSFESETHLYATNTYLPVKNFKFMNQDVIDSSAVERWQYSFTGKNIETTVSYDVWVQWKKDSNGDKVAIPVRYIYEMKVEDNVYDYFRHDYHDFEHTKPAANIVQKPTDTECTPVEFRDGILTGDAIDPLLGYLDPEVEHLKTVDMFKRFKYDNEKIYKNDVDEFTRLNIFKNNLRFIHYVNKKQSSFTVGINRFADFTDDEMLSFLNTYHDENQVDDMLKTYDYNEDLIDDDEEDIDDYLEGHMENTYFDWRDYNAVTHVKDQTVLCGSCYAFASVAAIESASYISRGCENMVELNEQAILDCTWRVGTGNLGCAGGVIENTLEFAKAVGLPTKYEYGHYLALEGRCHINEIKELTRIKSFSQVQKKKRIIKSTLRTNGPLVAAINTWPKSFLLYTGGVYNDEECLSSPEAVTHAVTLVGYGREGDQKFWIVRNTFGTGWGEEGYIRLAAKGNICGLLNFVFSVDFETNDGDKCEANGINTTKHI